MANALKKATMLWIVDTAGSLTTFTEQVWVEKIYYVPNAANDAITFQNTGSDDAIYLKAGATDATPVEINFNGKGRRVNGLKCSALSSSSKAYVYFNL